MPKNISFSGKICSGKDTMGEYFKKTFPNAIQLSFGNELKNEAQNFIDNIKKDKNYKPEDMTEEVYNKLKKIAINTKNNTRDHTEEMRIVLQTYGTEYRRALNKNYWVNKVKKIIEDNPDDLFYITDARFINEIEMLESLGTFLVKLDVSEEEQLRRLEFRDSIKRKQTELKHSSETELDLFDRYDFIIDTSYKDSQDIFFDIMREYRKF